MIITLSHQKGGVGKSTLVWNMIVEYSKNRKVGVIDLDMQKTITYSIQIRKNQLGEESIKNISLLNPRDDKEMVEMMFNYQKSEELLFIDSGGFDSSSNRIAMTGSDILITPVSSKFYEILGLKKYSEILDKINEELKKNKKPEIVANVVLNKIHPNTTDFEEINSFIENNKNFSLMKSILRQFVDYENSPGVGNSVQEYKKKGRAALDFQNFKKEVDSIMMS